MGGNLFSDHMRGEGGVIYSVTKWGGGGGDLLIDQMEGYLLSDQMRGDLLSDQIGEVTH